MAENLTPVSIGESRGPTDLARLLGLSAADVLRLQVAVIDREDRLESGTGNWLTRFGEDPVARRKASEESVLRTLRMATDATNFSILKLLTDGVGTPVEELEAATGLPRLALAERVGDLVSSGLATKLPEANQVAGVPAGAAIVEMVSAAAEHAARAAIRDV